MSSEHSPTDIAIIGMSALFPGAKDLRTYWQNILNKVDAIQEAPDQWSKPYFDANSQENDRVYTRKGGFLGDLAQFNPMEFGVMPNSIEGSDPDHFLALKLARDALADSGYTQKPFNQEKTGIILGRGSYINRGFTNVIQHGMMIDQTLDLLRQLNPALEEDTLSKIRTELKAGLLPFNAEMAPGIVPNVVTGRIANRLGLMGPNYIIDAACSSSLVSVELAIKELLSHRCDMMLAGGIHAPAPPQLHMMFCQLGALSRSNIRPFDQSANGTLLSEGIGIVVLKRLEDAQQDGDRIYAVIKGVGSSSDGKALGLLAPRLEGEVLAIQRAYKENNIDPDTVTLVEAHGTGIPLGDKTELKSLTQVFGERQGQLPHRALGSVKSMIGHCTIAAGAASLIKIALALYHKILPPTLCDEVNPELEIEKTSFYINNQARPWIHGNQKFPRRAGVNAFGFGGVNTHAVLEEYRELLPQNSKLLHTQFPTELLIVSSNSRQAVIDGINKLQKILQVNPHLSLANLAYTLASQTLGSHRLAIIAKDLPDLEAKLNLAREKLQETKRQRLQVRSGIYYAKIDQDDEQEKTAFLFPGEGSQYPNMLADLCLYFPKVRDWFDLLDETFAAQREHPSSRFIFPPPTGLTAQERRLAKEQSFKMDVASESVFTATMALYELLKDLGIKSDVMVGHSTGESTALIASGIVRLAGREELMEKIRHHNKIASSFEAKDSVPKGVLLAVGAVDTNFVKQLVANSQERLYLAMDNCPNQTVLFGSETDIDAAIVQLQSAGGICTRLPFDRGYHTPLFAEMAIAFREFYDGLDVGSGHTPLYSCATTEPFPTEVAEIRDWAANQWSNRVRFRETIEKLYNAKIHTFIEVGPSSNLTGFVDDILRGREYLAVASNNQRRTGLEQIQHLLARLFVKGIGVNMSYLYQHREVSKVDLEAASLTEQGVVKNVPVLELTMPRLQLKPEFIETIQDKLSVAGSGALGMGNGEWGMGSGELEIPERQLVNSSHLTTQPNLTSQPHREQGKEEQNSPLLLGEGSKYSSIHQQPTTNNQQPTTNNQQPITDSRLSILCAHFDLMQEFLDSQGRVMTSLTANLAPRLNSTNSPSPTALAPVLRTWEETWPLLGRIIEQDNQHLYSERHFDLEHDSFLDDHTLGPTPSSRHPELHPLPVIPLAISMEILAEAAAYLLGGEKVVTGLYDVRGYRWLALEQNQLDLGILAQLLPQQDEYSRDVHVQLFQNNNTEANNRVLVVEGYVKLAHQFSSCPTPKTSALENPRVHIWSDAELYSHGMYHGAYFQGVKHIRQVAEQGIEADLQVVSAHNFCRDIEQPGFQIHPLLLDAATHLIPYWIVDQFRTELFHSFPFEVTAFHTFVRQLSVNSQVLCRGRMSFTNERKIQSSFDFIDEKGRVIARLEGLQAIYLNVPNEYHQCRQDLQTTYWSQPWLQVETGLVCRRISPIPVQFLDELGGVIKPIVVHWMLNEKEREFWYKLPEKGPRRSDWLFGRIAAKDALRQWAKQTFQLELAPVDIEILSAALGKPVMRCPELEAFGQLPELSISHSRNYVVAVVAPPGMTVGIDIQRLEGIRTDDVMSGAFTQTELDLLVQLPQTDQAANIIGLWCAKEAAAKAAGKGLMGDPRQWQASHYSLTDSQVVIIHGGKSFPVKLYAADGEMLAICHSGLQEN